VSSGKTECASGDRWRLSLLVGWVGARVSVKKVVKRERRRILDQVVEKMEGINSEKWHNGPMPYDIMVL
jgi:hypothetical protein